ncbi:class I SAM-dependent methyltransferase [Flavobacterium sp.]|uniref:class I SAM-dependent methyltransferase n=1 Tax=Flavobacterium sp. TaxID=239 RepID=UPI0025C39A22|nr:class I SAM-dependent methyltransferase [Flavobacterium sp.]MBA4152936.1 methyltransferase [Flavobacterium sp.]
MNFLKKAYIKVKDHSVSGEEFELLLDENLQLLKTYPQPSLELLPNYYESEDYISHTDGQRTLFEKVYQFIKKKALNDKVKLIEYWHTGKGTVLDIGAGTGDFLLVAKSKGWKAVGMEPNSKAKTISKKKGICIVDNYSALEDHFFDVITMWHVLEHVPNLEFQIKELKRLLKPNGTIVIAVPNYKSFDATHYGKFWAAYDVPRHLWHFSKVAMEKLFIRENLKLKKVMPMWFDSFYVSLLSEKYKTGKMNLFSAFWVGLQSNLKGRQTKEYSSHIYIFKNN